MFPTCSGLQYNLCHAFQSREWPQNMLILRLRSDEVPIWPFRGTHTVPRRRLHRQGTRESRLVRNHIRGPNLRSATRFTRSDGDLVPISRSPELESLIRANKKTSRERVRLRDPVVTPPSTGEANGGGSSVTGLIRIGEAERHTCLLYTSPSPRDS